jgi:ABC-2 family transporter protein
MHKIAIIARREYQALVRTKAFIISLVIMPVFMFGGIFIQNFLAGRIDVGEKKVVVLDGTGRMFEPLAALARRHNETELVDKETGRKTRPTITLEKGPAGPVTDELRLALSERIHRNELFAFVEIDADALKRSETNPGVAGAGGAAEAPESGTGKRSVPVSHGALVRIHMESIAYNEVGRWLMQAINQSAFALRLHDAGLNPAVVAGAVTPINIEELGLYSHDAKGEIQKGDEGARGISFFIPFGLMLLMFISVMAVAQPMLSSVIEEKQQRIAEVLLGSASPFQIMMGKLLGNVGVALTIVAVYLTGAYILAAHYGYADLALGLVPGLRRAGVHALWIDLHRNRRGLHRDQGDAGPAHAGHDPPNPAADGLVYDRARTAERLRGMDIARATGHADAHAPADGRLANGPLVAAGAGHCARSGDRRGHGIRCRPSFPDRPLDARQIAEDPRTARVGSPRVSALLLNKPPVEIGVVAVGG